LRSAPKFFLPLQILLFSEKFALNTQKTNILPL